MTTTLPYRARIYCSLGEVISGQFADTYLQEAGLVFCRGSVELAGIYRPDVGTVVDFAYARGNTAARIPRRLRVLSSFADPFTRITSVQLGCKLSLLQDNREPDNVKPEDETPGLPSDYRDFFAGNVSANAAAQRCLTKLGITAAASLPLQNRYTVDEFDLSSGYVEVLGNLLQSECFVGYLNEQERLVVRSLRADQATAGPVLTSDNIFTLSPIGVGGLPGEAVAVNYTTLQFGNTSINPSSSQRLTDLRGWSSSFTVGFPVSYSIQYTFGGGPRTFNGTYTPTSRTTTRFSSSRPVYTATSNGKPYAAASGGFGSEALSNGISVPTSFVRSLSETTNRYDRQGRVSQTTTTEYISLVEFAGRLQLRYIFSPLDRVIIPAGGADVPIERTITNYSYIGNSVRRSVDRYQAWALTQFGQQAIAAGNASFTTSSEVSDFFNGLTNSLAYVGKEVTVTDSAPAPQQLPGPTGFTIAEYSPDGDRRSEVAEVEYVFGSSNAERRITFSLPYSPDSYFSYGSGIASPVNATTRAKQNAINYGRVQNKLRLGNRQGLSLQIPCELMPTNPFDCMYLVADGLVAQYRANGTSWTFNNQGIVGQVDALFWLAIGNTGTPGDFWFPGPPGVGTLPSAPTITTNASPAAANAAPLPIGWDFQAPDLDELFTDLPVATPPVFPSVIDTPSGLEPFAETVKVDAVGRGVFGVTSVPYSLAPRTTEVDMVGQAVLDVKEVALTVVPAVPLTLTALAPAVYAPAYVPVPSQALTLASYAPTISGAAVINMPAVALTLTTRRPEVRAATIVAVPAAALTLSAFAPVVSNGGGTDPDFSNVSLLLPLDGANGSTTITDESNNGLAVTVLSNAAISTAQSKFGGASCAFDGSFDCLSVASSTVLDLPGDFTIEFFAYLNFGGNFGLISRPNGSNINPLRIDTSSGALRLFASSNGTSHDLTQSGLGTPTTGTWQHIALTRSGSTWRIFIEGTQTGTFTSSLTPFTSTDPLIVGARSTAANSLDGFMDEVRITKGVARYTSGFTPPIAAFPTS